MSPFTRTIPGAWRGPAAGQTPPPGVPVERATTTRAATTEPADPELQQARSEVEARTFIVLMERGAITESPRRPLERRAILSVTSARAGAIIKRAGTRPNTAPLDYRGTPGAEAGAGGPAA